MIRPQLILGGPGCGKTTALLEIVEEALSRGTDPSRIAFVAFTRKAAQEARDRMVQKFNVDPDDIPYFRTLHSFAFRHLDVDRSQILDDVKLRDYAKAEGLQLSESFVDEYGQVVPVPSTTDETVLTADSLARLTGRDLRDIVADLDVDPDYASHVAKEYAAFKREAHLVDFTDMIERFAAKASLPDFDLLIVDEAQDLSFAQWKMVEKLVDHSRRVYYAGDDDQAIYAWAGADIDHFLTLDAKTRVLPRSYRLPRTIFDACQKVISLCHSRYAKDWSPAREGGEIDFVHDLSALDLSEGSWYLLARTNRLAQKYTAFLREQGFAYWTMTAHGMKSSIDVDPVRAVLVYENLRQGKKFPGKDLELCWSHIRPQLLPSSKPVFQPDAEYSLADLTSTGFDASPSWLDAIAISGGMKAYIRALRARGESLVKPPRIVASTIHGVKGGEADNVVVSQKLTPRTHTNWINGDDQEIRALFVAMSRAKDRLIFLSTDSNLNYGVERLL